MSNVIVTSLVLKKFLDLETKINRLCDPLSVLRMINFNCSSKASQSKRRVVFENVYLNPPNFSVLYFGACVLDADD